VHKQEIRRIAVIEVNGSRMFGRMKNGKYVHEVFLTEQEEAEFAAVMLDNVQSFNEAAIKGNRIRFNKFSSEQKSELMKQIGGV
jgi:hypothetical protein